MGEPEVVEVDAMEYLRRWAEVPVAARYQVQNGTRPNFYDPETNTVVMLKDPR